MALVALGSGLATGIDPVTCLLRGGTAFVVGWVLAGLWAAFVPPPTTVLIEDAAPNAASESDQEAKLAS